MILLYFNLFFYWQKIILNLPHIYNWWLTHFHWGNNTLLLYLLLHQEIVRRDWQYGNKINRQAYSHQAFSWRLYNVLCESPVFGKDHPVQSELLSSVCPHNSDLILWSTHSQASWTEYMLHPNSCWAMFENWFLG